MLSVSVGDWQLHVDDGGLPLNFASYLEHADFVDHLDIDKADGRFFFLGISEGDTKPSWPTVVIVQKYESAGQAFSPGILLLPDQSLVFVGAGERLLCYDIKEKRRVWEDETPCGFWGWQQSGPYVLMSAELEFGVWGASGKKLWSTFVEPPWRFEVQGQNVQLDVMGEVRNHRLADGALVD